MVFCVCYPSCCALLCVLSSFAIILMRTRDACCFALIVSLFSWLGLQCVRNCVIAVFPDHTHLFLFFFVHTGCNNSDQSDRIPRLIRVYAGRI